MATGLITRPYSGPEDDSLPESVQKLPKHGREIFAAAFNSAWDSYDPDESGQDSQEGYAMAVAWSAVKKVYKQNEDGEWVERSFILGTYEGMLTRVVDRDGVVTWRTTCSTICPLRVRSNSLGVALVYMTCRRYFSNSANFKGLLS